MELLSPAGSIEALRAAIGHGADAVYFGGSAFNARINAANFDNAAIVDAIDKCHSNGVKAYITINTLVFDREIRAALEFARFLYLSGADACIVQDVGLVKLIREYIPEFDVHASTQMGISTFGGLKFLEEMGVRRAVLSREVSLKDIEGMKGKSCVELETFVHGAMCVSFSGGCLFSSMIGGRSGNRGLCAQPCRKIVSCGTKPDCESDYGLSLGDMCMIEHVSRLKDAGISCVKIEGRMKKPEYVAAATYAYRRAIDGAEKEEINELKRELYNTFNRGEFTTGYYFGDGCETNRRAKASNTGVMVMRDREMRRIGVTFDMTLEVGNNAILHAEAVNPINGEKHEVSVIGGTCEKAKREVDERGIKRIEEQLGKLGNTAFHVKHSSVRCDDAYIAVSEINALRRKAIAEIEDRFIKSMKPEEGDVLSIPEKFEYKFEHDNRAKRLYVRVLEAFQGEAAYEAGCSDVILIMGENAKQYEDVFDIIERLKVCRDKKDGRRLFISLPVYVAESETKRLEGLFDNIKGIIDGIEINNWGQTEYIGSFKHVTGGSGLNVLNSASCMKLWELGVETITLSSEMNASQAGDLIRNIDGNGVLSIGCYGREVLMNLKHCPMRERFGKYGCRDKGKRYMEDEEGRRFPLVPVMLGNGCGTCLNLLLNCVVLDIRRNVLKSIPDIGALNMSFYYEDADVVFNTVSAVCDVFYNNGSTDEVGVIPGSTRGRWNG